ncbi:MAG TPA: GDSL-type esterase/lipase family protein [Acidobacteriaceae bacterium]
MRLISRWFLFLLMCGLLLDAGEAQKASPQAWMESWAAAQQSPEMMRNFIPPEETRDATVRQIFHLSVGGSEVRVRLSNACGSRPITFEAVHIARPVSAASGAIAPGSDTPLTFSGSASITVPAGAEYWSDPAAFPVKALSDVAVSFYVRIAIDDQTGHPGSRETTWYAHGNQVTAANLVGAQHVDHWYQVSGIEVPAPKHGGDVIALGDSITDGHATTTNGNDRWTDDLAERLQASRKTRNIGVLNEGIGGNQLLLYGLGPNVMARFDRDVLAQVGGRWVIVLEGVNDLGC